MYILLIISILALWYIQDCFYKKLWSKNLEVRLKFDESFIFEGNESILREVVVNDKKLPIPALDVRLAVNRNLRFVSSAKENSTISDQTYKRDVFSLMGSQQLTRKLRFKGEKRGFYEFKEIDVTAYNFFFHRKGGKTFEQNIGIFVYPAPVSVDRINLICKDISGMLISPNKQNPDPFEFYGIREYTNTDPMNYINWKASVRTGELMVNQFDSTTNVNLHLLLDVEDTQIWKSEELVEESIRIAASLAAKLSSKNMSLELTSNAKDYITGENIKVFISAGSGKVTELNQKLACADTSNNSMTSVDLINKAFKDNALKNGMDNKAYIFISKNDTQEVIEQLSLLAKQNINILWILPQKAGGDKKNINLQGVRVIDWEVEL